MKTARFYPFYAISFLFLSVVQKLYLFIYNGAERGLEIGIVLLSPLYFSQDAAVALFLCLVLDVPVFFAVLKGREWTRRVAGVFAAAIFFPIVFYSFIVLKFYSLFGTFLTHGLAIQAHKIENYKAGILNEVDLTVAILSVSAVMFFVLLFIARAWFLRKNEKEYSFPNTAYNRNGSSLFSSIKRMAVTAVIFIVYIAVSSSMLEFFNRSKNLYSLDYNPVYEIASSVYEAEFKRRDNNGAPGTGDKVGAVENKKNNGVAYASGSDIATEGAGKRPLRFTTDSLADRDSIIRGVDLKTKNTALRRNMNVVFFLLESTSGIYLDGNSEFNGYTPNIERLSASSLYLTNHYCQEPASIKSLYSILTGRLPYKTRDWEQFLSRSRNDITIADILKQRGYDTVFFTTQDGRIYYLNTYLNGRFNTVVDKDKIKRMGWNYRDYSISLDDRALVRLFDEYLARQKGRFFAFISAMFPHHPYITPSREFEKNNGSRVIDRYKNSLHFGDYIIGQVYDLLKKHDLADNTIFVLFSDHGEAFYQHPGNFIHSIYLYEENVKTLCLINNPILLKEEHYPHITRHIDIVPTVLDMLSLDTEGIPFDGSSLLKPHKKKVATFYTAFSKEFFGLRDNNWKYIINRRYNSEELYDLSADPGEKRNIASHNRELSGEFLERLIKMDDYLK